MPTLRQQGMCAAYLENLAQIALFNEDTAAYQTLMEASALIHDTVGALSLARDVRRLAAMHKAQQ